MQQLQKEEDQSSDDSGDGEKQKKRGIEVSG